MYADDYIVAYICYFLAVTWLTAKVLIWEKIKSHELRAAISLIITVVGAGVFGGSLVLIQRRQNMVAAELKLTFKDSPLLDWWTRRRITRDLKRFREYFTGLGIVPPTEIPPIGVQADRTGTETMQQLQLPTYRGNMMIGERSIKDPRAITEAYSHYVVDEVLDRRRPQHPSADTMQDMRASECLAMYFNWSFWDSKPEREGAYWASQLWQIRQRFGRTFTDQLLAFTLKEIVDTPEDQANADFDIYFYSKIKTADPVVDNAGDKLSEITEIIERSGINVTKPKAELAFSASGQPELSDDKLSFKIDVVNSTAVEARDGYFRIELLPGARFIKEPEGSTRDPSTTV